MSLFCILVTRFMTNQEIEKYNGNTKRHCNFVLPSRRSRFVCNIICTVVPMLYLFYLSLLVKPFGRVLISIYLLVSHNIPRSIPSSFITSCEFCLYIMSDRQATSSLFSIIFVSLLVYNITQYPCATYSYMFYLRYINNQLRVGLEKTVFWVR